MPSINWAQTRRAFNLWWWICAKWIELSQSQFEGFVFHRRQPFQPKRSSSPFNPLIKLFCPYFRCQNRLIWGIHLPRIWSNWAMPPNRHLANMDNWSLILVFTMNSQKRCHGLGWMRQMGQKGWPAYFVKNLWSKWGEGIGQFSIYFKVSWKPGGEAGKFLELEFEGLSGSFAGEKGRPGVEYSPELGSYKANVGQMGEFYWIGAWGAIHLLD